MVQAVMAEGSKLFASYMFQALEQTTPVDQLEATGAQYLKFAFDNEVTIGLDLPLAQLPAFSGGRISVGLASEVFGAQDSLGGPGYLVPPTVDEDPALPRAVITVASKSRAIHLQTFGDPANPPFLFLHGSLADHRAFLPFRELADAYFVVMWDQRGIGLSERISASEFTEEFVVEEIDAVRPGFMGASASGTGVSYDYAFGLQAFEPEVLLIASECSALGTPFQREYHVGLFKHVILAEVADAGHRMFVEQYPTVLELVRGYLSEYSPAPGR